MNKIVIPDFYYDKHVKYIHKVANDVESFEYLVSQYLRMSGVYWGISAMRVLGKNLQLEMNSSSIVEWVLRCQDPESGGLVHISRYNFFEKLNYIDLEEM